MNAMERRVQALQSEKEELTGTLEQVDKKQFFGAKLQITLCRVSSVTSCQYRFTEMISRYEWFSISFPNLSSD